MVITISNTDKATTTTVVSLGTRRFIIAVIIISNTDKATTTGKKSRPTIDNTIQRGREGGGDQKNAKYGHK
jgi:hypothetical protein